MFTEVTRYVTEDGKEHLTEEDATDHVSEEVHKALLSIFDGHDLDSRHHIVHKSLQIEIVEYLYKHRKKIVDAVRMEKY